MQQPTQRRQVQSFTLLPAVIEGTRAKARSLRLTASRFVEGLLEKAVAQAPKVGRAISEGDNHDEHSD